MEDQWTINGQSMDNQWRIHGRSMDDQWTINGGSMEDQWIINGRSMDNQWTINRRLTDDQWTINGKSMVDQRPIIKSSMHFGENTNLGYQKRIFVPKNNKHQTSIIMSKYEQVHQADDIEEPLVIVERVKHMGEAQQQERNLGDWNKAKCAGCVGATARCLTGGFWLSLVCATGCLYCAKQEGTAGGDVARACGSYAIKAQVMAREVDKQHHVVKRAKRRPSPFGARSKISIWNIK
jgi:hypothetical protein